MDKVQKYNSFTGPLLYLIYTGTESGKFIYEGVSKSFRTDRLKGEQ
jgi:hypothetical protein